MLVVLFNMFIIKSMQIFGIDLDVDWIDSLENNLRKNNVDLDNIVLKSGSVLDIPIEEKLF